MSLLLLEGFDTGDWDERATTATGIALVTGRTGANAAQINSSGDLLRWTFPAADEHATFIVGAAILATVSGGTRTGVIALRGDDAATSHLTVDLTSTGQLRIMRGAVELAITDPNTVPTGVWTYVELYATLSDTVGVVKLAVNGTTIVNLTNQDTKNAGTATVFDTVDFDPSAGDFNYDDVYVANGAGTVNNDLLGDMRVYAVLPTGNGTHSQMTGSDGNSTDNYLLVDEATPNDATDWVEGDAAGTKDTYLFADLPTATGVVRGVEVRAHAAKSDVGDKTVAVVHKQGAVETVGTAQVLSTTYDTYPQLWETDPSDSIAWTVAKVNSSEFGVQAG